MGRRERERGAELAAERVAADVELAGAEVCGEDAPSALLATVAARTLVALRLKDLHAAEREAAAAEDAVALAAAASARAVRKLALAEVFLHNACDLYGQATDALREARDAGALSSYVPPSHRGDAWEPTAETEVEDGYEEDPGDAEQRRAGAVR